MKEERDMERVITSAVKYCTECEKICSNDIIILLGIENALNITMDAGDEMILTEDEIIVINSKTPVSIRAAKSLYAEFTISIRKFRKLFPNKKYRFLCNSTNTKNDNFAILRKYLTELLVLQYERTEYQWAEWNKISCEILIFLVSNFATNVVITEHNPLFENITDYISEHFQEDLSLKQISSQFCMTPTYFSRFFKKNFGINYYQYLCNVRLENAWEDLLHSDKNLLCVAMDNGFPNEASFRKYFTERYEMSPYEYRIEQKVKEEFEKKEQTENLQTAIEKLGGIKDVDQIQDLISVDVGNKQLYRPYWREIINLRDCNLLLNYEAREQFEELQKELNFKYVRIHLDWSKFSEEEIYTFYLEEQVFDFLLKNNLKVWFTISVRELQESETLFAYLKKMLSHFAPHYGSNEIRNWRFELEYNTLFDEKKAELYWTLYDKIKEILEIYQIEELFGAGLELGDWDGIRQFEEFAKKNQRKLPALTMQVKPYVCMETGDGMTVNRITDSGYVKNQLQIFYESFADLISEIKHIYITDYYDSIQQMNILNDSCYRGASIIKNVIECFEKTNALPHSVPLDLCYINGMKDKVLFGGDGLITKQGLRKPSYHAYSFLQKAGPYYLGKNEYAIVFGNDFLDYQIICHNCKRLSYHYYLDEMKQQLEKMERYFDDENEKELKIRLENVKNGRYIVKKHSVNIEHGSVQDELRRIAPYEKIIMPAFLHNDDVEYLKQILVPQQTLRTYEVKDEVLELQITLSANEICYLNIQYAYE